MTLQNLLHSLMMLSKTVSLHEATKSTTALRHGIDNTPNPEQLENLKRTAEKIVDPVRNQFPTTSINSFFRSPALNRKIGGAKNSQHCLGEAVDLDSPEDVNNLAIFNFVKDHLVFDQVIAEFPNAEGVPSWCHASIRMKDNRGQVLVKLKLRYIPFGEYVVGMV